MTQCDRKRRTRRRSYSVAEWCLSSGGKYYADERGQRGSSVPELRGHDRDERQGDVMNDLRTNIIYNEDCIEGTKRLPTGSVDLILTDPPYNISGQGKCHITRDGIREINYGYPKFTLEDISIFISKLNDNGSIIMFYDAKYMTHLWHIMEINNIRPKSFFYWHKKDWGINPRRNFVNTVEVALWGVKSKDYVWNGGGSTLNIYRDDYNEFCWPPNNLHPNQKSFNLILRLISLLSNENNIILDPFMGVGTTALACLKLSRKFIGFEIRKEYCEKAEKRIEGWKNQTRISSFVL